MKLLNSDFNLNQFYDNLRNNKNAVLISDYDGTLSPFQVDRLKAHPYPNIRRVLNEISSLSHTKVVIVTGRQSEITRDFLRLDIQPEIWGSHGSEQLLSDGTYQGPSLSEIERKGLAMVKSWAIDTGMVDIIEEKPAGIAFHWRGLDNDQAESIERSIRDKWSSSELLNGIRLLDFDCGIELKAASVNKGRAVNKIISELDSDTTLTYLGDDLTDEDAFIALQGKGLSVLVREELRQTSADLWMQPPHELLDFLKKWAEIRKAQ
jgi:trehalose 6-phosphate phosphatase